MLHAFGRHWVLKTALDGYGELMRSGGRNLPEFLQNLPNFHTRVSLIFSHLQPPRFKCLDVTHHCLRLAYFSHRAGLAPFVEGLLYGLGEMFETSVVVKDEVVSERNPIEHFFHIEWDRPS